VDRSCKLRFATPPELVFRRAIFGLSAAHFPSSGCLMRFLTPKRQMLAQTLGRFGCNRLLLLAGSWRGLLVLNYHRVGSSVGSPFDRNLWSATQDDFSRQVQFLQRHFDVVGIDDLENVLSRRTGRSVMITFDDGYRDNYELVFPVLRAHGSRAVFFLTTGFLDHSRVAWWDEIAWMVRQSSRQRIEASNWTRRPIDWDRAERCGAIRQLLSIYKHLSGDQTESYLEFLAEATGSGRCPAEAAGEMWMTWDMVREMSAAGNDFGGHTMNHPVLSQLSPEDQDREIEGCRLRIAAELGVPPVAFSYPVGGREAFDEITRASLAAHGFRWAFSYYGGYTRPGYFDPLDLPRVAVESDVSFPEFHSMTALPQVFAGGGHA
jgi:peptidoglycan/xylan/chitin deacetylase (PgdA/CDA1 family)